MNRVVIQQFYFRGNVAIFYRFFLHQICAEVFLITVTKYGYDITGFKAQFALQLYGTNYIRTGGDTDCQSKLSGQLLSHDDGVSIGNLDYFIHNTLYAVSAYFITGSQGRRLGGLQWV